MNRFCIRDATEEDLTVIAAIHLEAFPGFFLTHMGEAFLLKYYGAIFDYKRGVLCVAESPQGVVAGFVAGFLDPEQFYRAYRKMKWHVLPSIIWAIAKRPRLIFAVTRNIVRVLREGRPQSPLPDEAELSSIGVASNFRYHGIGELLLERFVSIACKQSARVYLKTDEANNRGVRRFYEKLHFKVVQQIGSNSRPMLLLRRECDEWDTTSIG